MGHVLLSFLKHSQPIKLQRYSYHFHDALQKYHRSYGNDVEFHKHSGILLFCIDCGLRVMKAFVVYPLQNMSAWLTHFIDSEMKLFNANLMTFELNFIGTENTLQSFDVLW